MHGGIYRCTGIYFFKSAVLLISFSYDWISSMDLLLFMRCMTSNGICRGFAFKYGKFPLPLRYRTALSVPKVPTRVQ